MPRARIEWGDLIAFEPTLDDVTRHLPALAVAYNHPLNAPLLGHTCELSPADIIEHYERLLGGDGRPFLLTRDGALAGDADLRGIADGAAEFAFLIADPDAQGRGLGTRFALMIHAFAFETLGLARVYASVVPENVASRRVFEKLGYTVDTSETYGDEGDVILSLGRDSFLQVNAGRTTEIQIAMMR